MKGERALSHVYDATQLRVRDTIRRWPFLVDMNWITYHPNRGWVAFVPKGAADGTEIALGGPK